MTTIARKDAFCSIFRDLLDLHSFAHLRFQNLSKNSLKKISLYLFKSCPEFFKSFHEIFKEFLILLRKFDAFCPEFHETFRKKEKKEEKENVQKYPEKTAKLAENVLLFFEKFADNSGIHFSLDFIVSILSLLASRVKRGHRSGVGGSWRRAYH